MKLVTVSAAYPDVCSRVYRVPDDFRLTDKTAILLAQEFDTHTDINYSVALTDDDLGCVAHVFEDRYLDPQAVRVQVIDLEDESVIDRDFTIDRDYTVDALQTF